MTTQKQIFNDIKRTQQNINSITNIQKRRYKSDFNALGDVAILAKVQVKDNTWQIWLGGIYENPILIKKDIPNNPSARLELISENEDDYIISISWLQLTTDLNSRAIAVIYGKPDEEHNRRNWEILNDIRCRYLSYFGDGFWSSKVFNYNFDFYKNSNITAIPDSYDPPLGLSRFIVSGYHIQIEGLSTIAVEYHENANLINGVNSITKQGGSTYYDFVPQTDPTEFIKYIGSNIKSSIGVVNSEWQGDVNGPGNLGPGATPCTIGQDPIIRIANFPRRYQTYNYKFELNFNTQTYSFSAYNNQVFQSVGSHNYRSKNEQNKIIYRSSYYNVKKHEYIGSCQSYTSPNQDLWDIKINSTELWPYINDTTVYTNYPTTANLLNTIKIHPAIEKEYKFTALQDVNQNDMTATVEYFTPIICIAQNNFSKNIVWQEYNNSGECYINQSSNGRPHFYSTENASFKSLLLWRETQYELQTNWDTYQTTWQNDKNNLPVGHQPESPPYTRNLNLSFDPDEFNIFKKSEVKFLVNKYTAKIVNNKLTFEVKKEPQPVYALGMENLSEIAKSGTYPSVQDIRYWAKS